MQGQRYVQLNFSLQEYCLGIQADRSLGPLGLSSREIESFLIDQQKAFWRTVVADCLSLKRNAFKSFGIVAGAGAGLRESDSKVKNVALEERSSRTETPPPPS